MQTLNPPYSYTGARGALELQSKYSCGGLRRSDYGFRADVKGQPTDRFTPVARASHILRVLAHVMYMASVSGWTDVH